MWLSISSVWVSTSPSGWNSGGCSTPSSAATSGSTAASKPVSNSIRTARAGSGPVSIRVTSALIRSPASPAAFGASA